MKTHPYVKGLKVEILVAFFGFFPIWLSASLRKCRDFGGKTKVLSNHQVSVQQLKGLTSKKPTKS